MTPEDHFVDLVFEGGGVKGIGLAGAFAALEQRGYTPKNVAGTSAGAITAALVAAGYTPQELDEILLSVPFNRFKDEAWEDRIPIAGHGISLLHDRGLYEGKFFQAWIAELLERKGITRFGQLADPDAEDPDQRYRLRVIASDLTDRRMLVLPNDATHLGIDPDELEIAYAVRMSMSIPIYFEPVRHTNPKTGKEHMIVDGGLLSNFPVWLFDCHDRDPRWPTFGLLLVEPDPKVPIGHRLVDDDHGVPRGSLLDYFKSLAATVMAAHDRMYVEKATYARTIAIPTLGVGTTEFGITPGRVRDLYDSGHDAASQFLDRWDFAAYIEEYRRGKQHSRRADMLAEQGLAPPAGKRFAKT
jgi:NTE family protein